VVSDKKSSTSLSKRTLEKLNAIVKVSMTILMTARSSSELTAPFFSPLRIVQKTDELGIGRLVSKHPPRFANAC